MVNFSSSFLRKKNKLHSLLVRTILISILIFILIDASFTLILNKHLNKVERNLSVNLGLRLNITNAYFEIFNGILINGLIVGKDDKNISSIKNINLKLDFFNTILKKQIIFRKIIIKDLYIYDSGSFDKYSLSFLLSSLKDGKDIFKSIIIVLNNFNFKDLISLDLDGYVALAQNKLLLTRGKIKLKKVNLSKGIDSVFKGSLLDRPISYAFESSFLEKDFMINKLDLASSSARLILSGQIKDFINSANLELEGTLNNVLIEEIKLINNEYISTKGILDADFFINGLMNNPNFKVNFKISNGNVDILNTLIINKIDSNLIWDKEGFHFSNTSAFIGNSPINLDLKVDNDKNIDSKLSLEFLNSNTDLFKKVGINFQGKLYKQNLEGNAMVDFEYYYGKAKQNISLDFQGFSFDFQDFNFRSNIANVLLNIANNVDTGFIKKIQLSDLSGDMVMSKDSLSIKNIKTKLYNGILRGDVFFTAKDDNFLYNSGIFLKDLEMKLFAQDFLPSNYQLSGLLSGKIVLNSQDSEKIVGDIQINNGNIEENAVLIAISDFFGIPSLKTVNFNSLKILFRKIWDKFESEVNLYSQDIWIYLDNKLFPDDTMDGYLLVKLNRSLMDESNKFSRLFKYIEYSEPVVYFPFKLKGYTSKPRIEWLKNEFKEKLQDFLSRSNKKALQDGLNKLIEDFGQ